MQVLVIFNLKGQKRIEYASGSAIAPNNKAKALTFFQRLALLKEKGETQLSMTGDSTIIIQSLSKLTPTPRIVSQSSPSQKCLLHILILQKKGRCKIQSGSKLWERVDKIQ